MRPPTAFESRLGMRRDVILNTVRDHPWSSAGMLRDTILEETGGAPTLRTGALYLSSDTIYRDLIWLRDRGRAQSRHLSSRTVLWAVVGE